MVAFRSLLIPATTVVVNVLSAAASCGALTAFQWGWGTRAFSLGAPTPVEGHLPGLLLATFDYGGLRLVTDPTFDPPGPAGPMTKLEGPAMDPGDLRAAFDEAGIASRLQVPEPGTWALRDVAA